VTPGVLRRFLGQPGNRAAAVSLDETTWTFDDMLGKALAVARLLQAGRGVAGRVVLVRTGPGPLFSACDLGVLLAGGVPAVLPEMTPDGLGVAWRAVRPAAVLDASADGQGSLAGAAARSGIAVHRVTAGIPVPAGTPARWRAEARDLAGACHRAAAAVFTSGTTGTPQAVVLGGAALARGTDAWTACWPAVPEVTLSYLPVSHVAQRIMGHLLMCLYGTTVAESAPGRVERDMERHRPDTVLGVPRTWSRLATACAAGGEAGKRARAALAGVRVAVNGAAALNPAMAGALHRHAGLRVIGAYGATETTVPAFHQWNAALPGLGESVGVEHRVTGDGELLLRGPNLALGYADRWPALRPVTDGGGWLHTGDQVTAAGGGDLVLSGRAGSAFKTGSGEMISPEPAEAFLLACPHVDAACLLGAGLPRTVAVVSVPPARAWPPAATAGLERDLLRRAGEARQRGELPWCDLAAVRVVTDSWPALGLVTSTGKPRRDLISARYSRLAATALEEPRDHQ
jgi:acyl-CoA synthetase (AMP-forming)/AMP-acid ligase II